MNLKACPLLGKISIIPLGLLSLFPGVAWAQASQAVASAGISNELAVIIVTALAAPVAGALTKYWIDNRVRSYSDQWTAVTDSNKQLKEDRGLLVAELKEKDKEIERLEKEIRGLLQAMSEDKTRLGIYKYRLSQYEPTTGEVDRTGGDAEK
jgi:hypothetical protein